MRRVSRLSVTLIGIFSLLFLCCSPSNDVLKVVERGDYSVADAGKYPHRSRTVRPPSEYERHIESQRERIEENQKVMNRLWVRLFPEEKREVDQVSFEYRGASVNEESGELILWYMGPIIRPKINAGYRAQWVYDLKKGCLTGVYLSVVPLE